MQADSRYRLFDVTEAAQLLNLEPWRVYAEAANGTLPSRRVGRRIYFTTADLDEFLERGRTHSRVTTESH